MNGVQRGWDASSPGIELGVIDLWRELLGHAGPIEQTDNFFGLGGDSLTMMLFLFRAQEIWGVELAPAVMLEAPELRCVCHALREAVAHASQFPSGPPALPPCS